MHSLGDYKGKYVYIDVWATWCGPCIAEQPALEKLEEHYQDNQDIVFLGVSIDNDKAAWEKMVTEKALKGVQLLATNGFDSDLNKDYNISGIPRFILVDKNGNLISACAERPSSKTLQRQLMTLLEGEVLEGD